MPDWSEYKLGKDSDDVLMDSTEDNFEAALSLVKQAENTLDIFTWDLEPRVYNNSQFSEAVKNLCLKNKNVRVRILVIDPDYVIKHGHSLINLSRRLTSYIEIRKVHEDYASILTTYLIVDHRGVLHKKIATRYEGAVNYNLPMHATDLLKTFNEIWEKSKTYIDFKHLGI